MRLREKSQWIFIMRAVGRDEALSFYKIEIFSLKFSQFVEDFWRSNNEVRKIPTLIIFKLIVPFRFLVTFFVIAALALSSYADTGFTLRSQNTHKKYDFGVQYVAIVYHLSVPRGDYYVEGINSTNVQGLSNDNVQGLHIVHQFTRFLPKKVLDFYKNINHYHIVDSGLEILGTEQLDSRIRYVHFDDNQIRVIPKTFFAASGDMELISFERNRIESLEGDIFKGMTKLKWVSWKWLEVCRSLLKIIQF